MILKIGDFYLPGRFSMQNTGEESTSATLIPSGNTPVLLKSCRIKLKSSNSDKSIGFGSFFLRCEFKCNVSGRIQQWYIQQTKWSEDLEISLLSREFWILFIVKFVFFLSSPESRTICVVRDVRRFVHLQLDLTRSMFNLWLTYQRTRVY